MSNGSDWPPKVLVGKAKGRRQAYHIPIAPGAYTPRCARDRDLVREQRFHRRDRESIEATYSLCAYCDPEASVDRMGGEKDTWRKLAKAGACRDGGEQSDEADAFRDRINAALEQASDRSQEGDA